MKTNWNQTPRRFRPGKLDQHGAFLGAAAAEGEPPVPYARSQEHPLESLKNRLLREMLGGIQEPALLAPVRRAANEAASLAWLEPLPLLVFPELFTEKVLAATDQVRQQNYIRSRTARLMQVFA